MGTGCTSPASPPTKQPGTGQNSAPKACHSPGPCSELSPSGKDTVSSRALAITRFSIICRCRDSVCKATLRR